MAQNIQLRNSTVEDFDRLKECLLRDEYHKDNDPEWWSSPTGELITFYDEKGNRLFARIEKVIRVHIQHDPDVPKRNTAVLLASLQSWLDKAKSAGFQELIFESVAEPLINFCKKHLGYKETLNNFGKRL